MNPFKIINNLINNLWNDIKNAFISIARLVKTVGIIAAHGMLVYWIINMGIQVEERDMIIIFAISTCLIQILCAALSIYETWKTDDSGSDICYNNAAINMLYNYFFTFTNFLLSICVNFGCAQGCILWNQGYPFVCALVMFFSCSILILWLRFSFDAILFAKSVYNIIFGIDIDSKDEKSFDAFYVNYHALRTFQRSEMYKNLHELHTGKIAESNINETFNLSKLLEIFNLSSSNNINVIKYLQEEVNTLLTEYFNTEPILACANMNELLIAKIKNIPKREYIAFIGYLFENKRFLRAILRCYIFQTILDGSKDVVCHFDHEKAIRCLALIPNELLVSVEEKTSVKFKLNLDNDSEKLLNMIKRDEERLFIPNNQTTLSKDNFSLLKETPYIKSMLHKGITINKTAISAKLAQYSFGKRNAVYDKEYYYYLIDDFNAFSIFTILQNIRDELKDELKNSHELANSTQMQQYIFELLTAGEVNVNIVGRKKSINAFFGIDESEERLIAQQKAAQIRLMVRNCLKTEPILVDTPFRAGVDKSKIAMWYDLLTQTGHLVNPFNIRDVHTITIKDSDERETSYSINVNNATVSEEEAKKMQTLQIAIKNFVEQRSWRTIESFNAKKLYKNALSNALSKVLNTENNNNISSKVITEFGYYFTRRRPLQQSANPYIYRKDDPNKKDSPAIYYLSNIENKVENALNEYLRICEYEIVDGVEYNNQIHEDALIKLLTAISDGIMAVATDEVSSNLSKIIGYNALQKPYNLLNKFNSNGILINYDLFGKSNIPRDPFNRLKPAIFNDKYIDLKSGNSFIYQKNPNDEISREFIVYYSAINLDCLEEKVSNDIHYLDLKAGCLDKIMDQVVYKILDKILTDKNSVLLTGKNVYSYGRLLKALYDASDSNADSLYNYYGNYYLYATGSINSILVNLDAFMSQHSTLQYTFDLQINEFESNSQRIDSLEIKQYLQYHSDIYFIKMIMDLIWIIALFEKHNGRSYMQILVEDYASKNRTPEQFQEIFSVVLATKTMEVASKYKEIFFDQSLPIGLISHSERDNQRKTKIDMLAKQYITEYIRIFINMMQNQENVTLYDYYAYQSLGYLIQAGGLIKNTGDRFETDNVKNIKRLFIRDPMRFIPQQMKRFLVHKLDVSGKPNIMQLNVPILTPIASNNENASFTLKNLNPVEFKYKLK